MSDQTIIDRAARAHKEGKPLTDLQAKVIAKTPLATVPSAFYSFASTGAILEAETDRIGRDFHGELADAMIAAAVNLTTPSVAEGSDEMALEGLRAYAEKHGPRPQQENWSEITW